MENNVNFYNIFDTYFKDELAFQNMYIDAKDIDYHAVSNTAKIRMVHDKIKNIKALYDAFGQPIDDTLAHILANRKIRNIKIESINSLIIETDTGIIYAHF